MLVVAGVQGIRSTSQTQGPTEAYNRLKHYGRSPTKADRAFYGARPGESIDHDPPLVMRYYEGDPALGERPGFELTPEARRGSANDRSRMKIATDAEQDSQGGRMSDYSKKQRQKNGLE
jgi:hypothetical protein